MTVLGLTRSRFVAVLVASAFAGGMAGLLMFAFERFGVSSGAFRILLAAAIPVALVLGAQRLGWLPRRENAS